MSINLVNNEYILHSEYQNNIFVILRLYDVKQTSNFVILRHRPYHVAENVVYVRVTVIKLARMYA